MNRRPRESESLAAWRTAVEARCEHVRKDGRGIRFAPCPACGQGTKDTAWARPGRRGIVAGCNSGCGFVDLARALWPQERPHKRRRRPVWPSGPPKAPKAATAPENGPDGDYAALAEAVEARGPLHSEAVAWIRGRGLDPQRLEAAGWRSMSGPDADKLARQHGAYLPGDTRRARLLALIPVADADGRPLSVRVRPLDPHGPALTLPGDTARAYGADSLQAPGATVHVAEGEPDRESLIEAGALSAIGLPGASTCHPWLCQHLPRIEPRRVALWFDGDPAGRKAGESLAAKLTAAGLNVRRWEYRAGQDCNDHWRADPSGFRRAVATMEANE